ncbi:MAG: acyltransferase family protein [Pseudonocardia sp.]
MQGLRALAVALVVIYHVWFNRVSGGVDVFFVISGFLLTGQLTRAAERGPLDLPRRWSRMIVRLFPAAVLVLLGTAAAAAVVLPEGRWPQTLREVFAAGLFLENWHLAADSVDYTANNNVASVVQHFWSLSIQGQFFLVWPLLIAAVAVARRREGPGLRTRLTIALLSVFAVSLAFSIELTTTNQPVAYFHSLTRLWEFALGGLIALHIDTVTLTHRVRLAMGWVGVGGLLVCGMVFEVGSVFPGFAALWPTGCAALVLLAGATGDRRSVDRWLAGRPLQYLGDTSFTLYLWHWPVLVLYLVARDREEVGLTAGVAIIGLSVLLAVATHHLVEKPLLARRLDTRAGYRLGAAGLAAVLLVAAGWQVEIARRADVVYAVGDARHPGAVALMTGTVDPAPVLPPPVSAYEDWVRIEHWDCTPMARFPMDACAQPVEGEPTKRIVVVGDSHMQQLSGALIPIAQQNQWQLIAIVRGACPFSTASEVVPDEPDCLAWNDAAAAEIADLRPDAVVTLASRDVRVGLTEQTPPGFVQQWHRLDELGIPVLAVRDNPRFDYSMPDCIHRNARHDADSIAAETAVCGAPRDAVYGTQPPWSSLPDIPPNVAFLDIADAVCEPTFCAAQIGNVLVYLDDNHLSASYATSMAVLLDNDVTRTLG